LGQGFDDGRVDGIGRSRPGSAHQHPTGGQMVQNGRGHLGASGVVDAHEQDFGFVGHEDSSAVKKRRAHRLTYTRPTRTGTSMSGPTTPASAWPLVTPKVAIATAMASSKLLPAAVNASVVVRSYDIPRALPRATPAPHMRPK